MMYFGAIMKSRRKQLDLTQAECLDMAQMSQANYSKWETGSIHKDGPPTHAAVLRIAHALRLPEGLCLAACGLSDDQRRDDALDCLQTISPSYRATMSPDTGRPDLSGEDFGLVMLIAAVDLERLLAMARPTTGNLACYISDTRRVVATLRELAARLRKYTVIPTQA